VIGQPLVVAGIGTDVGKTVASAVLCELLGADYWKPVASGTDDGPVDHQVMQTLILNGKSRVHAPKYVFGKSLSPHVAASIEGVTIELESLIDVPVTQDGLVIELAGGLLVPLNDDYTNIDLLERWRLPAVVVSRHYLGSINHTLLTLEALKARQLPIAGIIFNGNELPDTERIIARLGGVPILGRLPMVEQVTAKMIRELADAEVVEVPRGFK
jgi:dethiobiotin synthetase